MERLQRLAVQIKYQWFAGTGEGRVEHLAKKAKGNRGWNGRKKREPEET